MAVPRGRVITYGDAARAAGFPGAARLTVRALRRFDDVPWHRVLGAGGRIKLTGEAGVEQRLRLEIERVRFHGSKVALDLHGWEPAGTRSGRAKSRSKGRLTRRSARRAR